jgi:hypothetical protein
MITRLPESSGNVIGFRITGKLTDDDYRTTFIPVVEETIRASHTFRVLFQMENFGGWTPHGAWDDFINWPKFVSCERMAVVIDENWQEFMTWLFTVVAKITHIEIRFFRVSQVSEAWNWLREP